MAGYPVGSCEQVDKGAIGVGQRGSQAGVGGELLPAGEVGGWALGHLQVVRVQPAMPGADREGVTDLVAGETEPGDQLAHLEALDYCVMCGYVAGAIDWVTVAECEQSSHRAQLAVADVQPVGQQLGAQAEIDADGARDLARDERLSQRLLDEQGDGFQQGGESGVTRIGEVVDQNLDRWLAEPELGEEATPPARATR